jgi:hypothetical protein
VATWNSANTAVETGFLTTRRATLILQLRTRSLFPSLDAPAFSQHGGLVPANYALSITAPPNTTIFCTLNGADPMIAGAAVYSSPIALSGVQITVKARARLNSTGEWSALTEAVFTLDAAPPAAGQLAISEVHYNPAGSSDDTEFVEIVNRSGMRVDLGGVHFTGAMVYTFGNVTLEPGARICVVENTAAFLAAYGAGVTVAGQWSGALNNSGDTIILLDKNGDEIERVAYSDAAPWPTDPDGGGYSLVRVNPAASPADPLNWRNSAALGGNPGASDGTTFAGSSLVDSDHDGFPALMEYFLGSSDDAPNPPLIGERLPDGRLSLRFSRKPGADDVGYTVEASADLVNWTVNVTRLQHATQLDGSLQETWVANTVSDRVFMRLKVWAP